MNLMKLMYAGYAGGSTMKGRPPGVVEDALSRRFFLVTRRVGGNLDFEIRCYEPKPDGDLRLRIRYGWTGNSWRYEPLAVRRRRLVRQPGDVVYRPDGSFSVSA